jgi:superfamily II DNA/RNA helicase
LALFQAGKAQVLVGTDVAARGIHVDDVACVIHYDPPEDENTYIHRSGRTGRAGTNGRVISLISSDQESITKKMQRQLGLPLGFEMPEQNLPAPSGEPHQIERTHPHSDEIPPHAAFPVIAGGQIASDRGHRAADRPLAVTTVCARENQPKALGARRAPKAVDPQAQERRDRRTAVETAGARSEPRKSAVRYLVA